MISTIAKPALRKRVNKKRPSSELYDNLMAAMKEITDHFDGKPTGVRVTRVIGETPSHVIWEELQPKPRTYKVRKAKAKSKAAKPKSAGK